MRDQDLSEVVARVVRQVMGEQKSVRKMDLNLARELIARVQRKAMGMGLGVVAAVYNAQGNPVAIECMDGALVGSFDIACGKAYTAAALQMSTARLKELAQPSGELYGIQHTNEGKIVTFGGGVPLWDGQSFLGGLGVSGSTEQDDIALAEYGAGELGRDRDANK